MNPDKCMGIDLGTTNSVAAILDADDISVLYGRHGKSRVPLMPSAVAFDPQTNNLIVGVEARARRGLVPRPIMSAKRGMGKNVTHELAKKTVAPADVSALILKQLVAEFRATLAEQKQTFDIRRAVITVPAHFLQPAMEDTTRAGQMAGLEVVELLHEPIAAAIHYCWVRAAMKARAAKREQDREETLMVFDLGGGTFDVCIIKRVPNPVTGADFQTLAIAGDSFLGGDNFDEEIARDLLRRIVRTSNNRIASDNPGHPSNQLRYPKLLALAEAIKIKLADAEHVAVERREYLQDDAGRPIDVDLRVTRTEMDTLLRPIAERTVAFCEEALEEAKLAIDQIDTILMVGGSSRLRLMQQIVKEKYCQGLVTARCPDPIVHFPDLCVGAGAALKAASLGRLYRPGGKTVVAVKCYGSCAAATATFQVDVSEDQDSEPLKGGQARLAGREGGSITGRILGPGRVYFDRIPLASERANFFTLSLRSGAGRELAGFDLGIRHDPTFVPPLGINTSANVLSYSLSLEVTDTSKGEVVKAELAPRLTPLPDEFTYHFRCPAGARELLFPIYGDNQLLKTIHVPLPAGVRPGADVELVVTLQANQQVRCRGLIPEASMEPFEFRVEPPTPEPIPTREEYRELCARADAILAQYPGKDGARRAAQVYRHRAEIDRAFETHDDARLIQRFGELRTLVEQMDPANVRVEPPLEKLEDVAETCYAVLEVLPVETTLSVQEMREEVDSNVASARKAAERVPPDQETYSRCYTNLERDLKALMEEYEKHDKTTPEEEAVEAIRYANRLYAEAVQLPLDAADQLLADEAHEAIQRADKTPPSDPKSATHHAREASRTLNQILKKHAREEGQGDPDDGIKLLETGPAAARQAGQSGTASKGRAADQRETRRHGGTK